MKRSLSRIALFLAVLMLFAFGILGHVAAEINESAVLAKMEEVNKQLAAKGLNIAVEAIEFFTIGQGRPIIRIHQNPTFWVPNDWRRSADGDKITYLVDQSDGETACGLTNTETEAAIDRALTTWNTSKALKKVDIVKRVDDGSDPDIYDGVLGFGESGDPFLADIVNAGWLPKGFFDAAGGPGGGDFILGFDVTYVFIVEDSEGNIFPTDVNGDNLLDTAYMEVYYNDNFGAPGGTREYNPWGINVDLPGVDVESVALHENGHCLGVGHFGPPPIAVMNPYYTGIRQSLYPIDEAGMSIVWSMWPNNPMPTVFAFIENPCNNDIFLATGEINEVYRITVDATGGLHIGGYFTLQGVSGVSVETGNLYQVLERERFNLNIDWNGNPASYPDVGKYEIMIVGQGKGNNFIGSASVSIYIDPYGIYVSIDAFESECK